MSVSERKLQRVSHEKKGAVEKTKTAISNARSSQSTIEINKKHTCRRSDMILSRTPYYCYEGLIDRVGTHRDSIRGSRLC